MGLADLILSVVPYRLPPYLRQYEKGVTPLSTTPIVVGIIVAYLITIFGIQAAMKPYQPYKLTFLFQVHNMFLSLGSGLLLACMLEEVIPLLFNAGMFGAICHTSSWTPRLEFYYIINYYFKYIELIDTIFLAIKKKPLAFLHVFHHSATALLCYTQLDGRTSVSWVPITLNLGVHVLMYYYYWATAGGRKIWWKKYLTTMQITQFVIDLIAIYFSVWQRAAHEKWIPNINLPHVADCAGTNAAAVFGMLLISSYLLLFIDFYLRTYKPAASAKKGANGVANGSIKRDL
ncbi:fatty acid elongase [Cantharellus anzutake]|uniref:fatty acid elongase n=1 Tax=Cantharellus anzutake TaxID=1750568 RepID=UPI001907D6E4|nr:fatty acid elongase [Cantharellus anzutake]XP_038911739.1 fatty acid elongase [Cantharellus anzutake]KAF8309873.1 fatty acid elongase [Cantharellus anzutake]KAF8324688.1 fatty acid elongase [Cantharellus anzutake]